MKNVNIMGVHSKIQFLGWGGAGVYKKPIHREGLWDCLKGGLEQFPDLRVGLSENKEGYF